MLVLSKTGSPFPLIWIGLLLTAIGPSGALKCYKCSGDACKEAVVHSEDCYVSYNQVCTYSQDPVEERDCGHLLPGDSLGCDVHFGMWQCYCDQDLCNTPTIWVPDTNPKLKCYKCSGDDCKEDVVPSEECDRYTKVCMYTEYPEERRGCTDTSYPGVVPLGCRDGPWSRECYCDQDLCNTPAIYVPTPGARKCYICSGDACKKDVVHSAKCLQISEVCWYYRYPEERRECGGQFADGGLCIYSEDESGCFCFQDLCNTPDIWEPESPATASASALFAVPLLIILGSLVSLAVG